VEGIEVKNTSSTLLIAVVGVMLIAIVVLPSLAARAPVPEVAVNVPIATPVSPTPTEEPVVTNEPIECQRATAKVCVFLEREWVPAYETSSGKRWQYVDTLEPGAIIPEFFESRSIIVLDATPIKKIKAALNMWKEVLNTESSGTVFQDEFLQETRVIGDNLTKIDVALDLGLILSGDSEMVAVVRIAAIRPVGSALPPYIVQYAVPMPRTDFEALTENETFRLLQDTMDSFDVLLNSRLLFEGAG
jgi:hypothetical protein